MLRSQALSIVTELSVDLIAATVVVLPLFFLPITTEAFEMPKQLLLVVVTLVLLILYALRSMLEGRCSFRRTPFDLALLVLFIATAASIFLSQSRSVALVSGLPFLAIILFTFLAVNTIITRGQERVVLLAAIISALLLSLLSILQFLQVYILPYPIAKTASFSLAGSLLTASIFLLLLLPIGIALIRSHLRAREDEVWTSTFVASSVLIAIGLIIGLYELATTAKPILLSQEVGLKTALQPLGINFQTALFGTGPGSYLFDFTRFRDPGLNATNLWNLRFINSSSFFLEMLATVGLLGGLSFLFLVFRTITTFLRNGVHQTETVGVFVSLVLAFLLSLLLPFSFTSVFLLFMLLILYAIRLANEESPYVFDVTISVVALKKGLIAFSQETETPPQQGRTDIFPYIIFMFFAVITVLVLVGIPTPRAQATQAQVPPQGFCEQFTGGMLCFLTSDIMFQKALVAASQNNAKETYDLQNAAIATFPQRDLYHRVFSQTNLAIANSIAQNARSASPSGSQQGNLTDQDKQTIITLVRQSIDFGRNASVLSPLNVVNWENLSNIYKNLIGFAQNADQFAVASAQQTVALDPTNPVLRIQLGGIFFQLRQYDVAREHFQTAVNLKPDFANAHYNLGHAFEAKGDTESLKSALAEYKTVRTLVQADSDDFKKIEAEIAALEKKIPQTAGQPTPPTSASPPQQEPLKISTPSAVLPTQKPPVPVEGPPATDSGRR